MNLWKHTARLLCMGLTMAVSSSVWANEFSQDKDDVVNMVGQKTFSPYARRDFPPRPLWGDSHLHTAISVDAGTMCRLGQAEAFRFALGEEVTSTHGLRVKLSRPLDWLVVSDHAELYGLMPQLLKGDPGILATEAGKKWYDMMMSGDRDIIFKGAMEIVASLQQPDPPFTSDKAVRHAWHAYTALADTYNDPGRFSAIIGYEYTTMGGNNMHRNVIFRGDSLAANRTLPYSQFDSQNPEDLWMSLDKFMKDTGTEVLAIPHNGNLSNGRMFPVVGFGGKKPLTKEMAELRARLEPIIEVTQIKGDGESHPLLSPDDEFADFDTWDASNLDGTEPKKPEMLQYEYARSGLKTGLKLEKELGVNPYKFGMVGGTDSHTALAAVQEDNFFGKHSGVEPEPDRWEHMVIEAPNPEFSIVGWQMAAGGLGAVWAEENTRAAIFDAMLRKETYATTGSRMGVRFFGGWNFIEADTHIRLPAAVGYEKGVPMGGDMRSAEDGQVPSFLVAALKDPLSGNLDRIQIIKGWLDAQGETQERIYDVAVSDGRKIAKNGRCKQSVGNTVDVKNATWSNSIGDPELIAVWVDPDFDPKQSAFYYARVIEIPTPRWTAYECKRFGIEMAEDVPMTTTERAYTSPIWYTP